MQTLQGSQQIFFDFVAEYLRTGSGRDASSGLQAITSGKLFALLQTRLFTAAVTAGAKDISDLDETATFQTVKLLIRDIIDQSSFLTKSEAIQLREKFVENV